MRSIQSNLNGLTIQFYLNRYFSADIDQWRVEMDVLWVR